MRFATVLSCLFAIVLCTAATRAANILLVTNNNGTSQSLNDFLVAEGHTVTRDARNDGPGDVSGFDLVLVARETNSGSYDDGTEPQDWNGLAIPIISNAIHIMRSSRWGWIDGTSLPGLGSATDYDAYPDAGHPFLDGVGSTTFLSPGFATTGAASPLPAGSIEVATLNGGASHGIFVFPEGTTMFNGRGTAGGLRIGYIRGNEGSWDNITADGEQILRNMITVATIPEPSTLVLAALGLLGLLGFTRRRRRK